MGSGKTSYAIQMINDNPHEKYIYITPYLSEVERIKNSCSSFVEPEVNNAIGELKIDSLNSLLSEGRNIVSTHALFKLTTKETIQSLAKHDYTLIMDEVAEVISSEEFKKDDLATILKAELAHVDAMTGYLVWDVHPYDGAHNKVMRLCFNKSAIVVNGTALVWVFPAAIFSKFKQTYICTYMFDVQVQKYYFDLNGLSYEYFRVIHDDNDTYQLIEYDSAFKDDTSNIKIDIYTGKKNDIGTVKVGRSNPWYYLSSSWYDRATAAQLKRVKDNLVGFFKNDLHNSPSELNLWTALIKNQKNLEASPYTKGFLACNARATNVYKDKIAVAYVINRFFNPIITNFFNLHNISITMKEQDKYALSELLQFVWRSAVRQNKQISLYLPSVRMRHILQSYLGLERKD